MGDAKETRKEQIAKSIKLIGWYSTRKRIKNAEDTSIFDKLEIEHEDRLRVKEDKKLKDAGISF